MNLYDLIIIGNIVTNILKIIFVTYALSILQNKRYRMQEYGITILMYSISFILFKDDDWRTYVIKNFYTVFIFIVYLFKIKVEIGTNIARILVLITSFEMVQFIAAISGSICALFISKVSLRRQVISGVVSMLLLAVFLSIIINGVKNKIIKLELSFSKKCMACFIYGFIVCIKIPFLYTEIRDALALKMVILTILCCTVIFLIISKIDKRNAVKEREIIEENNKKLSTKLHKSQEILPAMVQVLSHVTENGGTEMETQKAQELLEEVNNLYGRQLKENSKEDLQLKNFCSTGLKILDQQLKVYQMEASDRDVNLDIFVQAPINDIIKKDDIDQWKLQRAVGDLVRNAFRAVESEDKKCRANKHILLIIGCRYEGILEIAVVDNGTEFPLHVIEAFGNRGITTGGTGNGLADLVEFADEMGASISVDEFDGRTSLFTKRVSISFDKQGKKYFYSSRSEFVKGSFWNTR